MAQEGPRSGRFRPHLVILKSKVAGFEPRSSVAPLGPLVLQLAASVHGEIVTFEVFAGIMTAHRDEKLPNGTIPLTFGSKLGEFATPLAGSKAKFLQPPTLAVRQPPPATLNTPPAS